MRVGFVGLGKLGLPVAATMAAAGLEVTGYDPRIRCWPQETSHEEGFRQVIWSASARDSFHFGSLEQACRGRVVFVAVQTPHEPDYEGITPIPDERKDFDYGHLATAITDIRTVCESANLDPIVVVVSTVLPGTMAREIAPRLGRLRLVYNPAFIAMGTVVDDFRNPEFILLGGPPVAIDIVEEVHRRVVKEPRFRRMGIASAELAKVAYNTFIGLKLAFANTLQELCEKSDAKVDEVTAALKLADRRLISPAYLDAGMGDGGSCHPRDNIALSWLAREQDLSFDLFEATMLQRERHAEWLTRLLCREAGELPAGVLGVAYKPRSGLTAGSPALLVANLWRDSIAREELVLRDPYVAEHNHPLPDEPHAWLIGCRHPEFADYSFPPDSVVIDPWRYIPDRKGVTVRRLGE